MVSRQTMPRPRFRMARKAAPTRARLRTRARSDPSSHQMKFEAIAFATKVAATMTTWRTVSGGSLPSTAQASYQRPAVGPSSSMTIPFSRVFVIAERANRLCNLALPFRSCQKPDRSKAPEGLCPYVAALVLRLCSHSLRRR